MRGGLTYMLVETPFWHHLALRFKYYDYFKFFKCFFFVKDIFSIITPPKFHYLSFFRIFDTLCTVKIYRIAMGKVSTNGKNALECLDKMFTIAIGKNISKSWLLPLSNQEVPRASCGGSHVTYRQG